MSDQDIYREVAGLTQDMYDKTTGQPLTGPALDEAKRKLKAALERVRKNSLPPRLVAGTLSCPVCKAPLAIYPPGQDALSVNQVRCTDCKRLFEREV